LLAGAAGLGYGKGEHAAMASPLGQG